MDFLRTNCPISARLLTNAVWLDRPLQFVGRNEWRKAKQYFGRFWIYSYSDMLHHHHQRHQCDTAPFLQETNNVCVMANIYFVFRTSNLKSEWFFYKLILCLLLLLLLSHWHFNAPSLVFSDHTSLCTTVRFVWWILVLVDSCRCISVAIPRFEYEIDTVYNNRFLNSRQRIAVKFGKERVASPSVLMLKYHGAFFKKFYYSTSVLYY